MASTFEPAKAQLGQDKDCFPINPTHAALLSRILHLPFDQTCPKYKLKFALRHHQPFLTMTPSCHLLFGLRLFAHLQHLLGAVTSSRLKITLRFFQHSINFSHRVGLHGGLSMFDKVFTQPSHAVRRECGIKIFKQASEWCTL